MAKPRRPRGPKEKQGATGQGACVTKAGFLQLGLDAANESDTKNKLTDYETRPKRSFFAAVRGCDPHSSGRKAFRYA